MPVVLVFSFTFLFFWLLQSHFSHLNIHIVSSCNMGRSSTSLTSFCLSQIATRVRLWSPTVKSNPDIQPNQHLKPACNEESDHSKKDEQGVLAGYVGRRVMILIDSSVEANFALQWALSHAVQSSDTILLLDVAKPPKNGDKTKIERNPKDYELLNAMKNICQAKRPEVYVEVTLVEAKDRGSTIVEEARKQKISLLIMGQKRRSFTWRLLMMWAGKRKDGGVAEYCVQNATCMALAVRRKGSRGGGYLITTRRHKDFWLLA